MEKQVMILTFKTSIIKTSLENSAKQVFNDRNFMNSFIFKFVQLAKNEKNE